MNQDFQKVNTPLIEIRALLLQRTQRVVELGQHFQKKLASDLLQQALSSVNIHQNHQAIRRYQDRT